MLGSLSWPLLISGLTCWQILFFADQVYVTEDDASKEKALKHEVFLHASLLYKTSNLNKLRLN